MNQQGYYVCEIRGVCFVTWVSYKDKGHAAVFPVDNVHEWVEIINYFTGYQLTAVKPYV